MLRIAVLAVLVCAVGSFTVGTRPLQWQRASVASPYATRQRVPAPRASTDNDVELQSLAKERAELEKRLRDTEELKALVEEREALTRKLTSLEEKLDALDGPGPSPTLEELRPKGFGEILGGLPWWTPIALGWILAPQLGFGTPTLPDNIFAPPTEQQQRQMLREERSLVSPDIQKELYGR